MKAIKKVSLGSVAGGSGLRPNHLYELSKVQDFGHRSTFISAMTRFVNLFLSGKGPPQLAPWLCGAPLTAALLLTNNTLCLMSGLVSGI